MKILRNLSTDFFNAGCVMSIGNFDGMHLGHQAIINRVVENARQRGIRSVITTFEPHPHEFFSPDSTDRIMGLTEKYSVLSKLSVDYMYILRFNRDLANTSAKDFVENFLLDGLNVKNLIVGDDFRFGKKRLGDYDLLKHYADAGHFELENTDTLLVADSRVSSTRIRQILRESDFAAAEQLLGRPFFILGRISHGDKKGRELGFPTMNIRLKKNRTLVSGVFAVEIEGLGERKTGVANMGYRPTLRGKRPQLEVHIFDFNQQCYGEKIKVIFRHKLRDEKRFDSLDDLREQIATDAQHARQLLGC